MIKDSQSKTSFAICLSITSLLSFLFIGCSNDATKVNKVVSSPNQLALTENDLAEKAAINQPGIDENNFKSLKIEGSWDAGAIDIEPAHLAQQLIYILGRHNITVDPSSFDQKEAIIENPTTMLMVPIGGWLDYAVDQIGNGASYFETNLFIEFQNQNYHVNCSFVLWDGTKRNLNRFFELRAVYKHTGRPNDHYALRFHHCAEIVKDGVDKDIKGLSAIGIADSFN